MRVLVFGHDIGGIDDAVVVRHYQLLRDRLEVFRAAQRADVPLGRGARRVLQLDQRQRGVGADVHLDAGLRLEWLCEEPRLILLDDAAVTGHIDRLRLRARRTAGNSHRSRDGRAGGGALEELPAAHGAVVRSDLAAGLVSHEEPHRCGTAFDFIGDA